MGDDASGDPGSHHLLEQRRYSLVSWGRFLRLIKVDLGRVVVLLRKASVGSTVQRLARLPINLERQGAVINRLSRRMSQGRTSDKQIGSEIGLVNPTHLYNKTQQS